MGAQLTKSEAETATAKANGQENGHVKTNGDVSAKPEGEAVVADENGSAEVAKETTESGDAIEAAPATEGEAPKADGEAAKEATKKKKKFSLKNSFKFKGISLKKNKKGSEEVAESPAVEENGQAATETKEEEPADAQPAAETAETTENTEEAAAPAPEAEAEAEPKAEEPAPAAETAPTEESASSEETPAAPSEPATTSEEPAAE
ncbi:MARCKS-related protein 1-A [Hoplias malabaricus]|uniref:MARCKS-related protein 1-A n=1 Tax=Hoplias malabaricus TaxID=27720 RepID=UPI0034635E14